MTAIKILRPETAFQSSGTRNKYPRVQNKNHLAFIRQLPCIVTGKRTDVEAAHIRYASRIWAKRETGTGEKPDDMYVVPLHRDEHRLQHTMGEQAYWKLKGIDPIKVAIGLYIHSGNEERAELIIKGARL